jgi:uncharacterized protein YecE (DUF72 family)
MGTIFIGQAGWSIRADAAEAFPGDATHLERYARRLTGVEINSSFYKPHQPKTYARWAASVPAGFRFAVKAPREITHQRRLRGAQGPLEEFLDQVANLGEKRGPLLFQLPPSLAYAGEDFFKMLRERDAGHIVCEPRHPSWFKAEPEAMLAHYGIGRVAADPARVPAAAKPGGDLRLQYFRWHGSPRMYYSAYSDAALDDLATRIRAAEAEVWCIFDNTTVGAATHDALKLLELIR